MSSADDMIPIVDDDGLTVWVTRPPDACPRGHQLRAGDITTYAEGLYACACPAAEAADERPAHSSYRCRTCAAVTLVPECTDPAMRVGWAASHSG